MQYIILVNKAIIIHSQRRLDCSPVRKPAKRIHNLKCRPPYLIGRYFIYDYYYVPKDNYYILLYIIIITL